MLAQMQHVGALRCFASLMFVLLLGASCTGGSGGGGSPGGGHSISGLVTDMAQAPLGGVYVSAYGKSTTTDAAGKFTFSADVPPDRVVVEFQKESYFDQSIGKMPSPSGSTNMKVAMLAKEVAGSVDNAAGGKVATAKMRGDFPPESFARSDGSSIAGSVRVFAAYLDPDEPGFGKAMPGGDFSATDAAGDLGVLTSFGALRIEAQEEATGEAAQLKQKADICLAIPASMLAVAPDTMPVWRLNASSVWEETGTAQKVGNEYCFNVAVFGAINCDLFSRAALLGGKVCDGSNPARDTEVRVGQLSTQTDQSGEYAILVQSEVELSLSTDFGSATAGPLKAASANVADIGCSSGTGCAQAVENVKETLAGMPEGCEKQCGLAALSCAEETPCSELGPCEDAYSDCTALCLVNSTYADPVTGLVWQTEAYAELGGSLASLGKHCTDIGSGWRLPTITELRSLIRGCPATQCGATDSSCGACQVTDSCLSDSCNDLLDGFCAGCKSGSGPGSDGCYWPLEMTGMWSCSTYLSSSPSTPSGGVWGVHFSEASVYGGMVPGAGANHDFVRCVRTGP